ncbi:hypothetical protein GQ457_02G031820 [Hibiscus cannabinus]
MGGDVAEWMDTPTRVTGRDAGEWVKTPGRVTGRDAGEWVKTPAVFWVSAVQPNYAFRRQTSLPFVNGAVHWLGNRKRNGGGYSHVILGFDMSVEEIFEINLPENLIDLCHADLTIMKYGESSIAVSTYKAYAELHDLWVMKEYGLVESWTKVLTLHRVVLNTDFPRVMGFRKNGQVLLQEHNLKIASLDLNSQQMGASLHLNCQEIELPGLHFWTDLIYVDNYVESLVLLDKALHIRSGSDVNHHIYLTDSDESNGGESGVA